MNILSSLHPSIVCLVETKVTKLKSFSIKGYRNVVTKNMKKGKGGLLIAVKNNSASSVKETTTSSNENIVAADIAYRNKVFRIILCHGPQEEYSVDERREFYSDLSIEIENSTFNGSIPIILGDLNAKLLKAEDKIVAVSGNGQLLQELLRTYDLHVFNFHPLAEGHFTRIRLKNNVVETSLLDYMISTKAVFDSISFFAVDEEKVETPFRTIKLRKGIKTVYSDHCTLSATLHIPHETMKETPAKRWIITQDGLDKFRQLTESPFFQVEEGLGVDFVYAKCMNKLKETMGKCFREKEVKSNNDTYYESNVGKVVKQLRKYGKKGKAQRTISNSYIEMIKQIQAETVHQQNILKLQEAYQNLTENGKFSSNCFWKMCKSINRKQTDNKSSIIINGNTEIFGDIAIINAYKEEFSYRLRNRNINENLEEYQKSLELLVSLYLEHASAVRSQDNFTLEELADIIEKLARKKAPGQDGITTELLKAAGTGLHQALLDIFNYMKNNIVVPHQWEQVLVTTIYKGKGTKKELVNYRGIFLTSVLCKIFEKLIQSRINIILQEVSRFQAGATTNRSPADQLFLLRGALDHMIYLKRTVYITFYDYKQAFDSLWLKDCILSLWDLGIRDSYLPLIYKLNEKAVVTVNTPYGRTTPFEVEQIVKQGAVLASNICSVSTGEICTQDDGAPAGLLLLPPLAFVDDIAKADVYVCDVCSSHARIVAFSDLKKIGLNETKCFGMVVNEKKNSDPYPCLYVNGTCLKVEKSGKYLGDMINHKNNNDDLINDREKKAIAKLISIFATVTDVTLGAYQFSAHVLMYHTYYVQTLIFNCQSWTNITTKDVNKLRVLQLKYLKKMLRVPQATANCFVYLETGVIPIDHEIWRRQFTFLHHILNLDHNDPVRTMYDQMLTLAGEKNWANNMLLLRSKYGLQFRDEELQGMDVVRFKSCVDTCIRSFVFDELKEECKTKSKTKHLTYQTFRQQDYTTFLPPKLMHIVVKIRCGMLNTIHDRPYLYKSEKCRICGIGDESLHHILNCYAVSDKIQTINPSIYTDEVPVEYAKELAEYVEKFYNAEEEAAEIRSGT